MPTSETTGGLPGHSGRDERLPGGTGPCTENPSAPREDVQNRTDHRQVPIDLVGVSGLRYPIRVLDRAQISQRTVATFTLSVGLPHDTKGTHMSRFIEVLECHRGEITVRTLPDLLRDMMTRLEAETACIEVQFPYFCERHAPVSGVRALMDYHCIFVGEIDGGQMDFVLGVEVPVSSLCPCSKAISDYGAHNQRGFIRIETRSTEIVWIEELIDLAEGAASTPVNDIKLSECLAGVLDKYQIRDSRAWKSQRAES